MPSPFDEILSEEQAGLARELLEELRECGADGVSVAMILDSLGTAGLALVRDESGAASSAFLGYYSGPPPGG